MLLDISKTLYCLSRILNLFLLVYTNVQTVDYCWSTSFFLKAPAAAAAAKSHQLCLTLCNPTDGSPPGSPCPWDSPGKNTGVGCHFLLQRMKVKSESEVAQQCQTLSDPMDCSLPGSSVHGIFQARVLEWVAIAFSKGSSPARIELGSPTLQADSLTV